MRYLPRERIHPTIFHLFVDPHRHGVAIGTHVLQLLLEGQLHVINQENYNKKRLSRIGEAKVGKLQTEREKEERESKTEIFKS